jgi:hypothetical protein
LFAKICAFRKPQRPPAFPFFSFQAGKKIRGAVSDAKTKIHEGLLVCPAALPFHRM